MTRLPRLFVILGLSAALTFGVVGCAKKGKDRQSAPQSARAKEKDAEASKEKRKAAVKEKGKATAKGDKEDKTGDEDTDKADKKSDEGEAPPAVMGKARVGAKREGGILTAGSFDDNLFPEPYRFFVRRLGQTNQYVGDLPGQFLGQRLVIAVQGKGGRPVGNARVTVAPAGGGAAVHLTTRTDGTVVFLSSWDRVANDENFAVTVTPPDGSRPVRQIVPRRAQRWQIDLPSVQAALPKTLDLALVLDTTGSMGDELEYLKAEIKSIVGRVSKQFPEVSQRYALVLYRDEGMGDEYVSRTFPFTAALGEFRNHLSVQTAAGGGDYPEAMHKGLEEAVQLQWRDGNTARVLFLVADAPPHTQFAGRTMAAVDTLRKKGVAVYPVAASGADDACEFIMRTAALLTGGQYLFLTNDSGVGDAHGEPHIPYYHVQRLDQLMVRMIAGELAGKRIAPKPAEILRTVGRPINAAGRK